MIFYLFINFLKKILFDANCCRPTEIKRGTDVWFMDLCNHYIFESVRMCVVISPRFVWMHSEELSHYFSKTQYVPSYQITRCYVPWGMYTCMWMCVPLGCGSSPGHMVPAGFQPVCPAAFGLMVHSAAAWPGLSHSNTLLGLVSRIRHIRTYRMSCVLEFNIYTFVFRLLEMLGLSQNVVLLTSLAFLACCVFNT